MVKVKEIDKVLESEEVIELDRKTPAHAVAVPAKPNKEVYLGRFKSVIISTRKNSSYGFVKTDWIDKDIFFPVTLIKPHNLHLLKTGQVVYVSVIRLFDGRYRAVKLEFPGDILEKIYEENQTQ